MTPGLPAWLLWGYHDAARLQGRNFCARPRGAVCWWKLQAAAGHRSDDSGRCPTHIAARRGGV